MNRIALFATLGLVFTTLLSSVPAQAQNTRSFVSAQTGNDSNNCTRLSPCRTFVTAFAKTLAGGEINTLDPGGYGPLTINHSISIVSGLGEAGVLVPSGGTGIVINAGPFDTVNLRGLIIEGAGFGQTGIRFNTGANLTIEKCVVRNLLNDGIDFLPNAASNLAVSDTLVANVGVTGGDGIFVRPTGAGGAIAVSAVFNRVEVDNAGTNGLEVDGEFSTGAVNASVTDSVAAGNAITGFRAIGGGGGAVNVMLIRSMAANNGTGLLVDGAGATIWIGGSAVSGNGNGWVAVDGGVVQSYGTNQINGNVQNQAQIPAVTGGSN